MVRAATSADSVTSACTETATGEVDSAAGGVDAAPVVAVTAAIAAAAHMTTREVFLFMAFDARERRIHRTSHRSLVLPYVHRCSPGAIRYLDTAQN